MLSIGKLDADRVDYYMGLLQGGADEYYLDGRERPGYWLGSAAAKLSLSGEVDGADFASVLDGFHPGTGEALVVGAGRPCRVRGFDQTLSAPKSVSVAWAFADPATAKVISDAHDRAVAATVSVFESEVLRARRGHGGLTQIETAGVAAAAFAHQTSRAGDPQLHSHVVVANVTVDADGRWSAPDGRRVYGWAKTLGYLYEAELRHQLSDTLGVQWGPVAKGIADIDGVDPGLLKVFSKRRAQILAELDRLGYSSPAAARAATLATRPAKEPAIPLDDLRHGWADQAGAADVPIPELAALSGRQAPAPPELAFLVSELASPGGLTRNQSTFDRRDVLQGLAAAYRNGAPITQLRAGADQVLSDGRVVALATSTPVAGRLYSTSELLAVEAGIVASPARRASDRVAVVPVNLLERSLAQRPSLAEEQREMVARLTRSGAGIDVVVGRAGAGKTFALDAARDAWHHAGHPVFGAALAARAAAELESGAGIPSTTLDRLLADVEHPGPTGGFAPGSVVVLDEAGMVGSRKLARLLDAAERHRAKVVLVGDPRQLPEIEAGGGFDRLTRSDTAIELVDNRRQSERWERAALTWVCHL